MKHQSADISTIILIKQREVVLQVVRRADVHLTANGIFEEAKRLLPTISSAIVYNLLKIQPTL